MWWASTDLVYRVSLPTPELNDRGQPIILQTELTSRSQIYKIGVWRIGNRAHLIWSHPQMVLMEDWGLGCSWVVRKLSNGNRVKIPRQCPSSEFPELNISLSIAANGQIIWMCVSLGVCLSLYFCPSLFPLPSFPTLWHTHTHTIFLSPCSVQFSHLWYNIL